LPSVCSKEIPLGDLVPCTAPFNNVPNAQGLVAYDFPCGNDFKKHNLHATT